MIALLFCIAGLSIPLLFCLIKWPGSPDDDVEQRKEELRGEISRLTRCHDFAFSHDDFDEMAALSAYRFKLREELRRLEET